MTTNAFRSLHESPRGFNYRFVITHEDVTESTDNTAQDITLQDLRIEFFHPLDPPAAAAPGA